MRAGDTSVLEGARPRLDEAFQKLLLRFSAAAAKGIDAPALIRLFCRATREFFRVDGTYFWSVLSSDEMVGTEADGLRAESFRGKRLKASQSAVATEAVRLRKTVYVSRLDPARYPMAAEFRARSLMAAPLVVSSEVIGGAVFLRASDETPQLATSVRARHDRKALHFAAHLAMRAVAAGDPISVAIDPTRHALGDLVPAGMLIAAPLRTSVTQGAVLVYPRQEGAFRVEEKSLVSAVAGFGAVAIANAEL